MAALSQQPSLNSLTPGRQLAAVGEYMSSSTEDLLYNSNRAVCKCTGQENICGKQYVDFIAFPQTVEDHSTRFDIEAALLDGWRYLGRNKISNDSYEKHTYGKEHDADNTVEQFPQHRTSPSGQKQSLRLYHSNGCFRVVTSTGRCNIYTLALERRMLKMKSQKPQI
jgi:hypothetical protein